jgi:putative endonuclease
MMRRSETGALGEALALRHLQAQGMQCRERNWHCAGGEIDLVMQDGDTVVFVEVKARVDCGFGSPEEAVTQAKQRRLVTSAETYLQQAGLEQVDFRIDVVALELSASGRLLRLDYYRSAIPGNQVFPPG